MISLSSSLLVLAGSLFPPGQPPPVKVVLPAEREISDTVILRGWLEPASKVDIKARVGGELVRMHFKPGAEVKRGDLLFEIDPRPAQIQLARAEAELAINTARLKRL